MTYKDVILISPDEVKSSTNINYNVDDLTLSYTIRNVQNIYLEEIIGTALLRRIQEMVYNKLQNLENTIDDFPSYKELLDTYIKDFLTSKTMCDILVNISFKIRNIGVSRNSDTNINYTDLSDLKYLRQQYDTYANEYAERLSKYLCANKEDFAELYTDIPSYFKRPLIGKDFGNTGIWLGKENENKCSC